jgi:hypothetical protein
VVTGVAVTGAEDTDDRVLVVGVVVARLAVAGLPVVGTAVVGGGKAVAPWVQAVALADAVPVFKDAESQASAAEVSVAGDREGASASPRVAGRIAVAWDLRGAASVVADLAVG